METMFFGLKATIIGMGIIFAVLFLLAVITNFFSKIFDNMGTKKETVINVPKADLSALDIKAAETGINSKIVAAITAAISTTTGIPAEKLVFTAIRNTSGVKSRWANSGREDIINTRQQYL